MHFVDPAFESLVVAALRVLFLASSVLLVLAGLVNSRLDSARRRQFVWRGAVATLSAMILAELVGVSPALLAWRARNEIRVGEFSGNPSNQTVDPSSQRSAPLISRVDTGDEPVTSFPSGPQDNDIAITRIDPVLEARLHSVEPRRPLERAFTPLILERFASHGGRAAERNVFVAEDAEPPMAPSPDSTPWVAARQDSASSITNPVSMVRSSQESIHQDARSTSLAAATVDDKPTAWLGYGRMLAVAWLVGTALTLAWFIGARASLVRFRRRCTTPAEPAAVRRVAAIASQLGEDGPIRVLQSADVHSPVVFGMARPTIVLPAGFAARFGAAEQNAILAHEIAHVMGRDSAWQLQAEIVAALLWWQPLVWWARRQLRACSEQAADEASQVIPGGSRVLAGALVALARQVVTSRQRAWFPATGHQYHSEVARRVAKLLEDEPQPWRRPRRRLCCGLIAVVVPSLVLSLILSTAWARPQLTQEPGGNEMTRLHSSWRHSLAAVALVTLLGGQTTAEDEFAETVDEETLVVEEDAEASDETLLVSEVAVEEEEEEWGPEDLFRIAKIRHRQAIERQRAEQERHRAKIKRQRSDLEHEHAIMEHRIQARMRDIQESLARRPDGKENERLRDELHKLAAESRDNDREHEAVLARLAAVGDRPHARADRERAHAVMQRIRDRMQPLEREMAELFEKHGEGHPRIRHLHRVVELLENELRAQEEAARDEEMHEARRRDHHLEEMHEAERRGHHLRAAIENLEAAGLREEAHHLQELLAEHERDHERHLAARGYRPQDHEDAHRRERHEVHFEHLAATVEEMRAEMEEMRRHMHEMHEAFEHMREHFAHRAEHEHGHGHDEEGEHPRVEGDHEHDDSDGT